MLALALFGAANVPLVMAWSSPRATIPPPCTNATHVPDDFDRMALLAVMLTFLI